ncbi:hypothetical protein D3C81_2003300 [compost metagenome]
MFGIFAKPPFMGEMGFAGAIIPGKVSPTHDSGTAYEIGTDYLTVFLEPVGMPDR